MIRHKLSPFKSPILTSLLLILSISPGYAEDRDLHKGYRGFIESENFFVPNLGFIAGEGGDSDFWTGISTTHGYQLHPNLFVGGGMSCLWVLSDQDVHRHKPKVMYLPLFADIRTDLRFDRFTPFADLRMGCNLLRHGSFSGALTIGYRFSWGRRVALNLAIGVNLRGVRHEDYHSGWNENEGPWSHPAGTYHTAYDAKPVLRLGIDF